MWSCKAAEKGDFNELASFATPSLYKAHYSRMPPNLQEAAGLFWQQLFHEEKQSILLALEYECIAWFFQNQLIPSSNTLTATGRAISQTPNSRWVSAQNRSGLLGLQGLTASISFQF